MWRELVARLTPDHKFATPATRHEIESVESSLGCTVPEELSSALIESNGIEGPYGLGLIWSTQQIIERNEELRRHPDFPILYMPFDHLLFFADAGNGDYFGYPVLGGEVRRPDVFVWNHEDDSRTWFASSLQRDVEGWLTNELSV